MQHQTQRLKMIFLFLPNVCNFSEPPKCIHCAETQSLDIPTLIAHCKSCALMARDDPVSHKYVCYACTYCTYKHENIKKHIFSHLKYKKYACKLCDYKAVQKQNLEKHKAVRHSIF